MPFKPSAGRKRKNTSGEPDPAPDSLAQGGGGNSPCPASPVCQSPLSMGRGAKTPVGATQSDASPNLPTPNATQPSSNNKSNPDDQDDKSDVKSDKDADNQTGVTGVEETVADGAMAAGSRPRQETDKQFLQKFIKKVMKKKYALGRYFRFDFNSVMRILSLVEKILETEPTMVEMKIPCAVIGDLHGQYCDLTKIFKQFDTSGNMTFTSYRYVFLGDYVDRGKQSLETILLLFALKILHPTRFALLRGNHESRAINRCYGFYAEITERFKRTIPNANTMIFERFNKVFSHLPLACMIADSIICMHGGISSKIKTRQDILSIKKPYADNAVDPKAVDLLWADPMVGLPGEMPNNVRGLSVYFGEKVLTDFMANLNVKLVVRGHQMMMNGFNFYNKALLTVFSAAAYYPGKPNNGAVLTIDKDGKIGFKMVSPTIMKEKVFRGEVDAANAHDNGYVKVAPHIEAKLAAQMVKQQLPPPGVDVKNVEPSKSAEVIEQKEAKTPTKN